MEIPDGVTDSNLILPIKKHEYELSKVLEQCPVLVDKWAELVYALGLEQDMGSIKSQKSPRLKFLKTLQVFVARRGDNADFDTLIKTLKKDMFIRAADSVLIFFTTRLHLEGSGQVATIKSPEQITQHQMEILCPEHNFECGDCQWIISVKRSTKSQAGSNPSLLVDMK